jgi:hypothetical protein
MSAKLVALEPRIRDGIREGRRVPTRETALAAGALSLVAKQNAQLAVCRVALEEIAATPGVSVWVQAIAASALEQTARRLPEAWGR